MDYGKVPYGGVSSLAVGTCGGGTAMQTLSSSPVRDRISGLESLLSDLHSTISALEERFDTVLTPVPPLPARADNERTPTGQRIQSHLQGRLEILADGYQMAISRLHQLNSRIEL